MIFGLFILATSDLSLSLKPSRIEESLVLISLRWISDYVSLPPVSLREIMTTLTLGTAEVEDAWLWDLSCANKVSSTRDFAEMTFQDLERHVDFVIEIDNKSLTHRPDLWGHYGFARECAALFHSSLRQLSPPSWHSEQRAFFTQEISPIIPSVSGKSACLGYCGLSVDGVSAVESPALIQQRLQAVGLRPVNVLVDIGNYVMLETGIPLHIFDRSRIKGAIRIHQLQEPTQMQLLDGTIVDLLATDTVVADDSGPLVVAGIMGGQSSAVSEDTVDIFIECANWEPAQIRRTSGRIGVRTDSSLRYEKTLDTALLESTVLRAVQLIREYFPRSSVRGKLEKAHGSSYEPHPLTLSITHQLIERVLGTTLAEGRVVEILSSLEFSVKQEGATYTVTVPSFRATKDISCREDLIEELGRVIGYNNIPAQPPLFQVEGHGLSRLQVLVRKIQDFLVINGRMSEIMSYPLVGEELLKRASWDQLNEDLRLKNAWSAVFDRMRPSLVPSALEKVAVNQKSFENFQFFEVGRSYHPSPQDFRREQIELLICLFDRKENRLVELIEIVERLTTYLTGRECEVDQPRGSTHTLIPADWKGAHPFHTVKFSIDGVVVGLATEITPAILRNFKIRGRASLAVLDLELLVDQVQRNVTSYSSISPYPSSTFDVTVVVSEDQPFASVLQINKDKVPRELLRQKITSLFPLDHSQQAVTVRSVFHSATETLSAERVKELEDFVIGDLRTRGFPLKEG
jgi:phenylalanyl-tRNA synthetase beta chain